MPHTFSLNNEKIKTFFYILVVIVFVLYFSFFEQLYSIFGNTTGLIATLTAGIYGFLFGRLIGVGCAVGFFIINQYLFYTFGHDFSFGAMYFGQSATIFLAFLTGSFRLLLDNHKLQAENLAEERLKLKHEIENRKAIENKLIGLTNSLEDIVKDRTANLEMANEILTQEVEKRKFVQNRLENHFNFEKLISLISKRLLNSKCCINEDLKYILENIGQFTDADHCYLYFISEDGKQFTNKLFWHKSSDDLIKIFDNIFIDHFQWLKNIILYSQGIVIKSLNDFPSEAINEKAFFSRSGINSFIAVPFFIENKLHGFLGLDYYESAAFDGDELKVLNTISELLGIVYRKSQIENKLIENEQFLQSLLNSIHTGIIIIDPRNHNILDVNDYGAKMFGVDKNEMIGNICHQYICPAQHGACPITDFCLNVDLSEKSMIKNDGATLPILKSVVQATRNGEPILIESFTDISELKRVEIALRESEQKLQLIFNSLNDVIYSVDKDFKLVSINKSIEPVLGYQPEELIGKHIAELAFINHNDATFAIEYASKIFKGESLPSFTMTFRAKDGTIKIGEVISTLGSLNNNDIVISVARDVTERLENEKQLQSAHNDLLELNKKLINSEQKLKEINLSKDRFFSIISHDLRSPFMGLLGLSDLLNNDFKIMDDDEKSYIIDSINRSIKKVYELVDNLLQWSRIQTGSFHYNPEYFNLYLTIKKCIELFEANTFQKQLQIDFLVKENIEVFADVKSIEAVIQNLISNAIKFSFNGGFIQIKAYIVNDFVITEICDTGVGIYEADIDKLFALDEHFTTPGTNQETGSGLGLILCKEHIEKNGGQISVKSKLNGGTTFIIKLPRTNPALQKS